MSTTFDFPAKNYTKLLENGTFQSIPITKMTNFQVPTISNVQNFRFAKFDKLKWRFQGTIHTSFKQENSNVVQIGSQNLTFIKIPP